MFNVNYSEILYKIYESSKGKNIQADALHEPDMASIVNSGHIDFLMPMNLIIPMGGSQPPQDVAFDSVKIITNFTDYKIQLMQAMYNPTNGAIMDSIVVGVLDSSQINILEDISGFHINLLRLIPNTTIPENTLLTCLQKISYADFIQ